MKKENESKIKQNVVIKQTIDVLFQAFIMLYLALLLILSLVPLMFDFQTVSTVGKVFMVLGSSCFYIFCSRNCLLGD